MNDKLMKILEKAAEASMGQMAVVSENSHSVLFGTDCGETIDVKVAGGMVKLLLLQLPVNADSNMAFDSLAPFHGLFDAAKANGVDVRALVSSPRFAAGTCGKVATAGISSVELATSSHRLILPGYTHLNEGDHRTYPEAAAIKALETKRGKDLLKALWSIPVGERWTTQSLQDAASEISGKNVSSSVVHRFVSKLHDLELVAAAGATGFCLTADGAKQLKGGTEDDSTATGSGTQSDSSTKTGGKRRTSDDFKDIVLPPPEEDDDFNV